jgi:immune inhibitor A
MGSSKRLDAPSNGIRTGAEDSQDRHPHFVPPSPELRERLRRELGELRLSASGRLATILRARESRPPGLNDGMIYPPETFPLGTPVGVVRRAAADRAPLTGALRVIVVLVEFSDKPMGSTRQHFEALFFSTGVLPNGSVREYYREVSNSTVDIIGEVVGPYQLPRTMIEYANGESGTGWSLPNAQEMARHAAEAADPQVDFSLYDNDNNRYVDAFIVVHAGAGAESTGSADDI